MSAPRKPDSHDFERHLDALRNSDWLGPARSWWPDFLYHFTDVQNAAKILEDGCLHSRNFLQSESSEFVDTASVSVIQRTDSRWLDMVRLYFRPCSPTQYVVEGIRPESELGYSAHCPVPVVLLFDSYEILTRRDTRFTDGNLAAGPDVYGDSDAFGRLPFKQIYHSSQLLSELERRTITFHRNAEVIVPDPLNLTGLRRIATRSVAEYETLRSLLSYRKWRSWANRVETGVRSGLHAGRWSYIERVDMSSNQIRPQFNPDTQTPGPFQLDCTLVDNSTCKTYSLAKPDFMAQVPFAISLRSIGNPSDYELTVRLDGHLAYRGGYVENDLPF